MSAECCVCKRVGYSPVLPSTRWDYTIHTYGIIPRGIPFMMRKCAKYSKWLPCAALHISCLLLVLDINFMNQLLSSETKSSIGCWGGWCMGHSRESISWAWLRQVCDWQPLLTNALMWLLHDVGCDSLQPTPFSGCIPQLVSSIVQTQRAKQQRQPKSSGSPSTAYSPQAWLAMNSHVLRGAPLREMVITWRQGKLTKLTASQTFLGKDPHLMHRCICLFILGTSLHHLHSV